MKKAPTTSDSVIRCLRLSFEREGVEWNEEADAKIESVCKRIEGTLAESECVNIVVTTGAPGSCGIVSVEVNVRAGDMFFNAASFHATRRPRRYKRNLTSTNPCIIRTAPISMRILVLRSKCWRMT